MRHPLCRRRLTQVASILAAAGFRAVESPLARGRVCSPPSDTNHRIRFASRDILRWRWVAVVMVDKDGPRSSRFSDKFTAVIRNPNIMLDAMYVGWEDTKNPYYAWSAIEICNKHKKAFPTWVVDYLAGCAERMLSDKATKSKDLRKILPSVLGFSAKRGPGRPLDPDHVPDNKLMFALLFAIEIQKGRKPSIARKEATKHLPGSRADRIDDKTLQRWLKEVFDLVSSPRTVAEWKSITRRHYGAFATLFREIGP